ncbi:MAG: GreA/GreB family elongation factor [Burkholderiales bacterium]
MSPLILTEADFANLSLLESPKLKRRLAGATRVPSDAVSPAVVTMNSMVSYRDMASGERGQVQVVYPQDARSRSSDRTSVLSSFGMALLGASRGETVECGSGAGRRRLYVEEVLHQPESSMQKHLFVRG